MSKKKDKSLVLESPGISIYEPCTDIFIVNDEEFKNFPISVPTKELNVASNSEPIKIPQNKQSPERKRRLRLLK